MITVKNPNDVSVSANIETTVPFTTLICNTNNNTTWNASTNSISMNKPGRYNTTCTVVISTTVSTGGEFTLSLMANGSEVTSDYVAQTLSAAGTVTLTLPMPIQVTQTNSTAAQLSWAVTSTVAATVNNSFATVTLIN